MNNVKYLYLSKEENDEVFIDISQIVQYQIDGIRFLYQQFKKRKPGVVFNDPRGCRRTQQIVLFVNALKYVLEKPVLVLCYEDAASKWLRHLQERIETHDDVSLENSNPFGKNMVYINTMKNLESFGRRDWGIVIVHDDNVSKQMSKTAFKADFKIWITHIDMKHNLQAFSSVHKWIFRNEVFVIEDYVVKENNTNKDAIEKAISLDAFLEDIVLRRDYLTPSPTNSKERCEAEDKTMDESAVMPRVTKKNKDATGTKIKRTKRKLENDTPTDADNDKNTTAKESKIAKIDNEVVNSDDSVFDSYVANNEPSTSRRTDRKLNIVTSESNSNSNDFVFHYGMNTNIEGHCSKTEVGIPYPHDAMVLNINIPSPVGCTSSGKGLGNEDSFVMDVDFDEKSQEYSSMSFKDAIQDIVDNENVVTSSQIAGSPKRSAVTEVSNKTNTLKNNEADNASENTMNIDAKISEMEEKAMKKFKGSLLDTIF